MHMRGEDQGQDPTQDLRQDLRQALRESLTESSEGREDATEAMDALAALMALEPVTYSWDRSSHPDRNFPEGREIGFIAQDLARVLPSLVYTAQDGYK